MPPPTSTSINYCIREPVRLSTHLLGIKNSNNTASSLDIIPTLHNAKNLRGSHKNGRRISILSDQRSHRPGSAPKRIVGIKEAIKHRDDYVWYTMPLSRHSIYSSMQESRAEDFLLSSSCCGPRVHVLVSAYLRKSRFSM
ncbi:unnamed protein product [Periconia digitata]|uniref:Uncharacterized protein n=1 Tax=Periconia digitata TaxID=1303443 RepID=A0A9W4XQ55_9PLEO|nr:unnamed protein product [Periconia digitata]